MRFIIADGAPLNTVPLFTVRSIWHDAQGVQEALTREGFFDLTRWDAWETPEEVEEAARRELRQRGSGRHMLWRIEGDRVLLGEGRTTTFQVVPHAPGQLHARPAVPPDLAWASAEAAELVGTTPQGHRVVLVQRRYNFGTYSGHAYWTSVVETTRGGCKPLAYVSECFASRTTALAAARAQMQYDVQQAEYTKASR